MFDKKIHCQEVVRLAHFSFKGWQDFYMKARFLYGKDPVASVTYPLLFYSQIKKLLLSALLNNIVFH